MKRRQFIVGGVAFAALLACPAIAADSGGYLDPFRALAKAIRNLLRATDLLAEGVTRDKFRSLAIDVERTLGDIQNLKSKVFGALIHPACSSRADPQALERAAKDAKEIMVLLGKLSTQVRRLGRAVRPSGVADTVIETADQINALRIEKGRWIEPIGVYCSLTPNRRTQFRTEVRRSQRLVLNTRHRLAALIEKLS